MHATVAKHHESSNPPAIRATIVAGENDVGIRISDEGTFLLLSPLCLLFTAFLGGGLFTPQNQIKTPSDLFSFSHVRNATRLENSRIGALRSFSSSPQGIRATVGEQVDRWKTVIFSEVEDEIENTSNNPEKEAGVGPHPRIGIGLPMSNIFAT